MLPTRLLTQMLRLNLLFCLLTLTPTPPVHADGWVFDHYDYATFDTGTYWQTGDTLTDNDKGSISSEPCFSDCYRSDPYDNYSDFLFTATISRGERTIRILCV